MGTSTHKYPNKRSHQFGTKRPLFSPFRHRAVLAKDNPMVSLPRGWRLCVPYSVGHLSPIPGAVRIPWVIHHPSTRGREARDANTRSRYKIKTVLSTPAAINYSPRVRTNTYKYPIAVLESKMPGFISFGNSRGEKQWQKHDDSNKLTSITLAQHSAHNTFLKEHQVA